VVDLSVNVPGPVTSSRLRDLGAQVIKIEPPTGDPLALVAPEWYQELRHGKTVLTLDLKEAADRNTLDALLTTSDLLITASRPQALARLGLDWPTLHERIPWLCHVAIIGYPPPEENVPGHDLGYMLSMGLCEPPTMPRTLLADLGGAERAVSAALGLLLNRERKAESGLAMVSLFEAAGAFAGPLQHGLTVEGGYLGGGNPFYNLYQSADSWVALVALEPHFVKRLLQALRLPEMDGATGPELSTLKDLLTSAFRRRTTAAWLRFANTHDLPISAPPKPSPR